MAGPPATAQMHASVKRSGQPCVAGHHQCQAPSATDAGKIATERRSIRVLVVAEYHTGETARQPSDRWPWVGQAERIGEQPQRWNGRAAAMAGAGPCEQPPIHRATRAAVLTNRRT